MNWFRIFSTTDSSRADLRKITDIMANVVIIVVGLLVVFLGLSGGLVGSLKSSRSVFSQLSVGDTLPAPHGLDWSSSEHTLVLALAPDCDFCRQNLPLYKRLTIDANDGRALRCVVLFPDFVSLNRAQKYIKENGLSVAGVATVSLPALHISGTPTLLLLDRRGQIQGIWNGKLREDREAELWSVLRTLR